jgi:hypothetical protein
MGVFENSWRDLRNRQRFLVGGMVAFAVIPMAVALLTRSDTAMFVTAVIIAVFTASAGVWHHQFRCPACGELFFRLGMYQTPLTRACLHCRCQMGATEPPGK